MSKFIFFVLPVLSAKFWTESSLLQTPYHVNLLIGGVDEDTGPVLYFMDYLASSIDVPFAAHGYGSHFCLSILDRLYHPNLTRVEALNILDKCMQEVLFDLFTDRSVCILLLLVQYV